jgi:hypothetical protein
MNLSYQGWRRTISVSHGGKRGYWLSASKRRTLASSFEYVGVLQMYSKAVRRGVLGAYVALPVSLQKKIDFSTLGTAFDT